MDDQISFEAPALDEMPGITPAARDEASPEADSTRQSDRAGHVRDDDGDSAPALEYLVVGFGCSAGGLKAFRDLLGLLPDDTGMTFVLVPHLAPDQASHLPSIAGQFTEMAVHAIEPGIRPLPNNLYILQPNQIAELQGGVFVVQPRAPGDRAPRPIDVFFRSLGADQKGHAIGVVLSGTDADGALGLKDLRGDGGLAIVQTPQSAQHGGMPRSSIRADHVDLVLAPREIAVELARLAKQFVRPHVRDLEAVGQPPTDAESYAKIITILRSYSGLELRQYKQDILRRRMVRRMVLLRMESLADYARYLQTRRDELKNLQEDLLINITRFFRDPSLWEALPNEILPPFFERRSSEGIIRIWCAGCSTGEEVYSFAAVLLEYMSAHGIDSTIQIFGTDASERSIDTARAGLYPDSIATEISPERLRRFFVKTDRGYQVNKRLRDLCVFARQNLCTDPPFSHLDFVLCRNVLIYFKQGLQREVISTFHYALNPAGHLFLGSSENLRDYDEAFRIVDRGNKIYTKVGDSLPGGYDLPLHRPALTETAVPAPRNPKVGTRSEMEMRRTADRVVLARFGPPGLIVDEHFTVLQARGQTSAFVELASGTVSLNLSRVLRAGLLTPVRETLERAIGEGIPTTQVTEFQFRPGEYRSVCINAIPLGNENNVDRTYLILFSEIAVAGPLPAPVKLDPTDGERQRTQLGRDLSSTRLHLQSLIEERDARNQELVSANEEIQSANEELQSTNEESETNKEELQSANEGLQTVNEGLQQRNAILAQTGIDLSNLLTSVNIPLLMLTDNLEIRQFTPPMERLLNIRAADIGRSIREIRLQLSIENIEPILQDVLDRLAMREVEVQDRDGRWHLLRVRPYRTADNRIEGLVVLLVDINQLRASQKSLQEAKAFADAVIHCVPLPVVVLSQDGIVHTANVAFQKLSTLSQGDLKGRSLPDLFARLWGIVDLKERLDGLAHAAPGTSPQFECRSASPEGTILSVAAQALRNDGDTVLLLTVEDVTVVRRTERTFVEQRAAMQQEIDQTGRTLVQAQSELRELAAHLFTMQEEERVRVARELHDDVAQRLSLVSLGVNEAQSAPAPEQRSDALARVRADVDTLNADVRLISHRLHPAILEELGLVAGLKQLLDDFGERERMFTTLVTSQVPEKVDNATATTLYRITQEALRNVAKHAGKTHVKALLAGRDGQLGLEIRDFGLGFDQGAEENPPGLGLISIVERARIAGGRCLIESSLGRGTTVIVEVPIHGRP